METPRNAKAKKQENLKSRFDRVPTAVQPKVKDQLKTLRENKENLFKTKKNNEFLNTINETTINLYRQKEVTSKAKNINCVIPK